MLITIAALLVIIVLAPIVLLATALGVVYLFRAIEDFIDDL